MSLASMLRTTVDHERQTSSKDASGGIDTTWTVQNSGVKCDIQPVSAATILWYMERQMTVSHTIYFSRDIQAIPGDRFLSGGRYFKLEGYRRSAPGYKQWPAVADVQELL